MSEVFTTVPVWDFPQKDDAAIAEIIAMDVQLHALAQQFSWKSFEPNKHLIGQSLNMIRLLSHDISYTAETLYERYTAALGAEEESANEARLQLE